MLRKACRGEDPRVCIGCGFGEHPVGKFIEGCDIVGAGRRRGVLTMRPSSQKRPDHEAEATQQGRGLLMGTGARCSRSSTQCGIAGDAAPHILIVGPLNDAGAPQLIAALAKKGGSGIMPLS